MPYIGTIGNGVSGRIPKVMGMLEFREKRKPTGKKAGGGKRNAFTPWQPRRLRRRDLTKKAVRLCFKGGRVKRSRRPSRWGCPGEKAFLFPPAAFYPKG